MYSHQAPVSHESPALSSPLVITLTAYTGGVTHIFKDNMNYMPLNPQSYILRLQGLELSSTTCVLRLLRQHGFPVIKSFFNVTFLKRA